MIINVHAGHNPDGKVACGATGLIKESTEARKVKDEVINQLRLLGNTVYDCTCEDGKSQSDILSKIVKKCNVNAAELDVSIHFNAGAGDCQGNGKSAGTEVFVYNSSSKAKRYAENVCAAIEKLGFKNRGVKYSTSLYVLRKTKAPAMLIECCFVDDKDDVMLYDYKSMAAAIVYGIIGKKAADVENIKPEISFKEGTWYKVLKAIPIRNGYYGKIGKYKYLSTVLKRSCEEKGGDGYLKKGCIICPAEVKRFEDGSVWFMLDETISCLVVGTDGTVYVETA